MPAVGHFVGVKFVNIFQIDLKSRSSAEFAIMGVGHFA